jgi:hypothetical protein
MKERQEETNRKKLHHYGVKEGCKNCKKECNLNFDKARRLELNTRYCFKTRYLLQNYFHGMFIQLVSKYYECIVDFRHYWYQGYY